VVVGSGIDVIRIARIEQALARHGERFAARVFTPRERSQAQGRREAGELAVAFALKEAVMKALGTGWAGGVRFVDIETQRAGLGHDVALTGGAAAEAARRGIARLVVAASRDRTHAVAVAIAEGGER
jgi:holo-[acyl-carrier protein] synthase